MNVAAPRTLSTGIEAALAATSNAPVSKSAGSAPPSATGAAFFPDLLGQMVDSEIENQPSSRREAPRARRQPPWSLFAPPESWLVRGTDSICSHHLSHRCGVGSESSDSDLASARTHYPWLPQDGALFLTAASSGPFSETLDTSGDGTARKASPTLVGANGEAASGQGTQPATAKLGQALADATRRPLVASRHRSPSRSRPESQSLSPRSWLSGQCQRRSSATGAGAVRPARSRGLGARRNRWRRALGSRDASRRPPFPAASDRVQSKHRRAIAPPMAECPRQGGRRPQQTRTSRRHRRHPRQPKEWTPPPACSRGSLRPARTHLRTGSQSDRSERRQRGGRRRRIWTAIALRNRAPWLSRHYWFRLPPPVHSVPARDRGSRRRFRRPAAGPRSERRIERRTLWFPVRPRCGPRPRQCGAARPSRRRAAGRTGCQRSLHGRAGFLQRRRGRSGAAAGHPSAARRGAGTIGPLPMGCGRAGTQARGRRPGAGNPARVARCRCTC